MLRNQTHIDFFCPDFFKKIRYCLTIKKSNMLQDVLLAADTPAANGIAAAGAGLAAIGAGIGIGRIGGSALESIARQPEALNDIRSNMILAAALVEGAAFFAMEIGRAHV